MKKNIIGIIGGGNMGEALIKGLSSSNHLIVCESNRDRVDDLRKKYKIVGAQLPETLSAEIIIIAIKPQDMMDVLVNIRQLPSFMKEEKIFISIAAGMTTKYIEKQLGYQARVIRCMPNMPALIGEGITAICAGRWATTIDLKAAEEILRSIGQTVIVKEPMIDAVTAVSGSGPAYVFLFVEQWINAAMKLGFNHSQAKQLVYKTLSGSTHLLEKSEFDASQLRAKVTSKGGTTQAAMDVFSKGKFDQLMYKALLAAKKRAKELAK